MADSISTTAITNLDASPQIRPGSWVAAGNFRSFVGTLEGSAAAAAGSTYRFFRINSGARVSSLTYSVDALSAGAVDIGIYDTLANGGAVVAKSLFASTFSTDTAKLNQSVLKPAGDIANAEKRVWELLGLSADPMKQYDVTATVVTAIGNAGTQTLHGSTVL